MWVLETEARSSARAASTYLLSHLSSPPSKTALTMYECGWPGTQHVNHIGLKLTEILLPPLLPPPLPSRCRGYRHALPRPVASVFVFPLLLHEVLKGFLLYSEEENSLVNSSEVAPGSVCKLIY